MEFNILSVKFNILSKIEIFENFNFYENFFENFFEQW